MKKKTIPMIISAIMLLAGCASTVIGILKNSNGADIGIHHEFDPFTVSDEDVGKNFGGSLYIEDFPMEETENGTSYLTFVYDKPVDESDRSMVMCFDVPKRENYKFEYANGSLIDFRGTLRKGDDELTERLKTTLLDMYHQMEEQGYDMDEEGLAEMLESISPYYVEVAEAENGGIYIWAGGAVIGVALFMLLTTLFGKRFLIVFGIVVVLPVIVLLIVLANKLRTMASIKEVSDGLYTMRCHYDYKCDEFLNADIGSIDELTDWLVKEHFFGLPIEFNQSNFGCSAFTAETPEGQRIFGRNFDYDETDTLVIYTEPKDGYASYGVADLTFFDIGTDNGLDGNSLTAKALMLCAPYVVMDGINEAGVGVGILQLDIEELHQDNDRSDLLIAAAIRGILDNCADIDEALALLENYDMHSFLGYSYHLFVTDKTGRSVVVEWTDGETFIVEDNACTNDVMSENEFYDPEWKCERYDTIKDRLSQNNGILTEDEAMSLASDARRHDTQWSCIYNLDEFTLDICLDRKYETKHSFTRDDLR